MGTNLPDKRCFSLAVLNLQKEEKSTKLKKKKNVKYGNLYIKHLCMKMDFLHCRTQAKMFIKSNL